MDPTITRVECDLTDLQRSLNTKRCYTQILTRLQRHYGCPLDELGPEEVRGTTAPASSTHGIALTSWWLRKTTARSGAKQRLGSWRPEGRR